MSVDYNSWDYSLFDLVLFDSPYLNTSAVYNGGANKWDKSSQSGLLDRADQLSETGKKFIFFGQTFSNGIYNYELDVWSKRYSVKVLKNTSVNCSNNRKNGVTEEVMVWNY